MINFTGLNIAKTVKKIKNADFLALADNNEKQHQKFFAQLSSDVFEKVSKDDIFSQKTFNKAREFVIQSILADAPRESMAVILDDKIVFTKIGDKHSCSIGESELCALYKNPNNKIAIIHSHPRNQTGGTNPVSIGDYEVMCNPERPAIRSICAINSNGEYSSLKKIDDKKAEDGYMVIMREFENAISKYLMESDNKMCIKYRELENQLSSPFGLEPEDTPVIEAMNNIEKAIKTPEFISAFWQEFAEDFGVKYETNFDGLC